MYEEFALWLLDGPSVAEFGLTAQHLPRHWPWETESLYHQFVLFDESAHFETVALWQWVDRLSNDRLNWRIISGKPLIQVAHEALAWRQCSPQQTVLLSANPAHRPLAMNLGIHKLDTRPFCETRRVG